MWLAGEAPSGDLAWAPSGVPVDGRGLHLCPPPPGVPVGLPRGQGLFAQTDGLVKGGWVMGGAAQRLASFVGGLKR